MNNNLVLRGANWNWGANCLNLNGNSYASNVSSTSNLRVFDSRGSTIEIRFKLTSGESNYGIFGISTVSASDGIGGYFAKVDRSIGSLYECIGLFVSNNRLRLIYANQDSSGKIGDIDICQINYNEWYTVEIVYGGGNTFSIYVNSLHVSDINMGIYSRNYVHYISIGGAYYKSNLATYGNLFCYGSIAAFRLYTRALTVAEIESNYALDVSRLS